MARLKQKEFEQQNNLLATNINTYKKLYGITDGVLAKAAGCAVPTMCKKRNRPETFLLRELISIAQVFHIPLCKLLMDSENTPRELSNTDFIIRKNIKKLMCFYGISFQEMALYAHMCKDTLYTRLESPGSFTLKELRLITRKLKAPLTLFLTEEINLNEKVMAGA